MIKDRYLIMLIFVTLAMILLANNSQNKRLKLIENKNKMIESNLEILNYSLDIKDLVLHKAKKD